MTGAEGRPRRRWVITGWGGWLAVWTVLGLVIRVAAVLGRPNRPAGGDAYYYNNAANLLVEGKGFINPFLYLGHHQVAKTAAFPPGFVFILAAASLVGFKSYFSHRIWCALIGAAGVAVCGYTAREVGGRRVGLITAFLVAVYPNLWMSDEMAMSETVSPIAVAVVLLLAYRFWKSPSLKRGVWLGLSIGVAALIRDELTLLGLLIFVPVVLLARSLSWKQRGLTLAAGGVCALAVVAPWVGWNMSRFTDPVLISTGLGPTLASTNCNDVYYGPHEGYWSMGCALAVPPKSGDESVQAAAEQTFALHYVRTHESRLVPVLAARLGRAFGLFHPIQQIKLDSLIETRPVHWALLGLWMYYCLAVLSVAGAVILRRRRVPLYPLLAVGLTVALSVATAFGDTRYRTTFEVSLVVLASVAVDWIWGYLRGSGVSGGAGAGAGALGSRPEALPVP